MFAQCMMELCAAAFAPVFGGHVFALLLMLVSRNTNTFARAENCDVKVVFLLFARTFATNTDAVGLLFMGPLG